MTVLIIDGSTLCRQAISGVVADNLPGTAIIHFDGEPDELEAFAGHDLRLVVVDIETMVERRISFDQIAKVARSAKKIALEKSVSAIGSGLILGHRIDGYVLKNMEAGALSLAIRTVFAGGVFIPAHVMRRPRANPDSSRLDGLTTRQQAVLLGVQRGLSNLEIARELGITTATVKAHLQNGMRVLGARNRVEAAMLYRELLETEYVGQ